MNFIALAFASLICACGGFVLGCSNGSSKAAKCSASSSVTCTNGAAVQACVTTNADGTCASEYYSVGSQAFACTSCADCSHAVQSAVQACGGGSIDGGVTVDDSGSSSSMAFIGSWSCSGTTTKNFTLPPGEGQKTQSETSTVSIAAQAGGGFVVTSSADGGANCSLNFTTSGAVATLEKGQSCAVASGPASVTETFTGGSSAVSLNKLNLFYQFTFSASSPISIAGSGTSNSTCTKL